MPNPNYVWVLGTMPKNIGRGETPFVRVYADKGAMLRGLDGVLIFQEAAAHLVELVEGKRGRRETFTFDYLMDAAPDYAIDEAQLEEELEWIDAIWLEFVEVVPPDPEYAIDWPEGEPGLRFRGA